MTAPHKTPHRSDDAHKSAGVSLARPLVYLGVAAVIGLGSLLLPSTGSARPRPPTPSATAPTNAPGAACSEVKESLRPEGPLPPPGAMPAGSTMARIAARGRLIAGVDQGKYLVGYRNPITGRLEGSDIDIVRHDRHGDLRRPRPRAVRRARHRRPGGRGRPAPGGPRRQQLLGHLRPAARRGVLHGLHGGNSPDPRAGQLRCERGRGPRGEARVHLGGLHHGAHAAGAARPAGRADAAGHPGLHGRAAARPGRGRVQRRRAARGPGGAGSADPRRRAVAAAVVLRGRHAARRPGPRALRQRRARAGPRGRQPRRQRRALAGPVWTPCPSPRPPATATERPLGRRRR